MKDFLVMLFAFIGNCIIIAFCGLFVLIIGGCMMVAGQKH